MTGLVIISVAVIIIWLIYKYSRKEDDYSRTTDHYNRNPKGYNKEINTSPSYANNRKHNTPPPKVEKKGIFSQLFERKPILPFDEQAITWCANFLSVDENALRLILAYQSNYYKKFLLGKRSGGYRTISAPQEPLISIQRTIHRRILAPVNIHPAATGFRHKKSVADNARPHLGKDYMLKVDIIDFFGSIKRDTIRKTFQKIGYPLNIAEVLTFLCCLRGQLPQGAPTSPALSNIVAYEMDQQLYALATENNLTYTRYADDITLSGNSLAKDEILPAIQRIVGQARFRIKHKKTRYMTPNRRKIITGISVSSGEKLTIPKTTKREIRKNVHFITTRGLNRHQQHIKSQDPSYLKRLIGQLCFWHSIEPQNEYVQKSLDVLKKIEKRVR